MIVSDWEWIPGRVDLSKRYFELKYGNNPAPIARVGISAENYTFIVEFILPKENDYKQLEEIFKEVIYEIELYLVNNSIPDPLNYMINHTHKCANLYSRVHWVYYPKGSKKAILLEKKKTSEGSLSIIKKFFQKINLVMEEDFKLKE